MSQVGVKLVFLRSFGASVSSENKHISAITSKRAATFKFSRQLWRPNSTVTLNVFFLSVGSVSENVAVRSPYAKFIGDYVFEASSRRSEPTAATKAPIFRLWLFPRFSAEQCESFSDTSCSFRKCRFSFLDSSPGLVIALLFLKRYISVGFGWSFRIFFKTFRAMSQLTMYQTLVDQKIYSRRSSA